MNQGKDNAVRGLLQTEYETDQPTATRIVEQLQEKVKPVVLSKTQRTRFAASVETEDRGYLFTIRMPRAGDTWIQAGYTRSAERLFIVSMEVAARYRRNGFSTALLRAAIHHAEQTRGPVNAVKGEAGGTNYRILHAEGKTIADSAFAKSMAHLGFDTSFSPETNEMLSTHRQPGTISSEVT